MARKLKAAKKEISTADRQIMDIAWTLYNEARGEGEEGMRDVASVLHKRFGTGKSVEDFYKILNKAQFNGFGEGSPDDFRVSAMAPADNEARAVAQQIAVEMATGKFQPTVDASHYYNADKASPGWGPKLIGAQKRGNHTFGNLAGEYGNPRLKSK
jgi:spore germination cell wall hydrolase CwlJ-like protein